MAGNILHLHMPMAAKDGVARGMTRFNLAGMDLNRNWTGNQIDCVLKNMLLKSHQPTIDKVKNPPWYRLS
jgi:hypothetical protein